MKLSEAIEAACESRQGYELAKVIDFMRFRLGWNYERCAETFKKYGGVSAEDFENLSAEADYADSDGI